MAKKLSKMSRKPRTPIKVTIDSTTGDITSSDPIIEKKTIEPTTNPIIENEKVDEKTASSSSLHSEPAGKEVVVASARNKPLEETSESNDEDRNIWDELKLDKASKRQVPRTVSLSKKSKEVYSEIDELLLKKKINISTASIIEKGLVLLLKNLKNS